VAPGDATSDMLTYAKVHASRVPDAGGRKTKELSELQWVAVADRAKLCDAIGIIESRNDLPLF